MEPQLFAAPRPFSRTAIEPVNNAYPGAGHCFKPAGGLWTSTWDAANQTSAWVEFAGKHFGSDDVAHRVLLVPKADAQVYTIQTRDDAKELWAAYPRTGATLDFAAMAADGWDALHVVSPMVDGVLTYWDIESTIWFRWSFFAVIPV